MMKILIINPAPHDGHLYNKEGRCEARKGAQLTQPISLGIISALLKREKFDVKFLDLMTNPLSENELREIVSQDYKLAFINTTTPTFPHDKEFTVHLRKINPALTICAFGTIVTALPDEALNDNSFDIVIRREPEYTILDICKLYSKIESPTTDELSKIKGISFVKDARVLHNELRPFIENLDELPLPDRDIFDFKSYIEPKSRKPYTVIRTSRGCPYGCTFCTVGLYYGSKWRTRSTENIIKEIEEVITKYNIRDFMFLSDTFTANKQEINKLCNEIIKRQLKIRWVCNSRVDTLNPETAALMKKAGCWMISFGVESASKKILEKINKKIKVEQALEAAEICEKVGIKSYMYFMIGFPWDTKETIKETVDFAIKVNSDFVRFYFVVPYPGTPLYKEAEEQGYLKSREWSRYDQASCNVLKVGDLSFDELKKEVRKANFRFYFRIGYLRKLIKGYSFSELINLHRIAFEYFKSWYPKWW